MILKRLDWCGGLRHVFGTAGAFALSLPCVAADVDSVLVRQQWPWSTDVKVEYRLSNVTAPVNIKVECFNNGVALPSEDIDSAIVGRTYGLTKADEGIGFFYIDPVKAFGKTQVSLANFTVKLSLSDTDAIDTEPIYKIIDLLTKTVQNLSRADFYNDRGQKYGGWETNFAAIGSSPSSGEPYTTSLKNVFIWTGVTNNIEYKTTKLVMRRIPAKDQTFLMGGANDFAATTSDNFQIEVKLTNDYWIGVFEVTKRQSELFSGKTSSSLEQSEMVKPYNGDKRHVSYHVLRGLPSSWEGWPNDIYAVGNSTLAGAVGDSTIKKIRNLLSGMVFDLPTEAQWEYACRAGTDTQNYSGVPVTTEEAATADLVPLALSCKTGFTKDDLIEVGSYRPNAFGLYDILGNVGEAVRDLYDPSEFVTVTGSDYVVPMTGNQEEPMGWNDAAAVIAAGADCKMMYRGGTAERDYKHNRCADRRQWYGLEAPWSYRFGYRLWLKAE